MSQDRNEELNALDSELAQMALETPDMPEDFHARWTEQVRAEAAKTKTSSRNESRRQWRYILSAAAVFVFLIGGTMLTRSGKNVPAADTAKARETVLLHTSAPTTVPEPAAEGAAADREEAAESVLFTLMAGSARKSAESTDTGAAGMTADMNEAPALAASSAMEADAAYGAAEDSAYEAAEEASEAEGALYDAYEAAYEDAEAAEEAGEAEPAAAADEESEEDEEPAPEEKKESEFVSFLKDLGTFTLRMLPVLLLALAAVLIGGKLNKRKK